MVLALLRESGMILDDESIEKILDKVSILGWSLSSRNYFPYDNLCVRISNFFISYCNFELLICLDRLSRKWM